MTGGRATCQYTLRLSIASEMAHQICTKMPQDSVGRFPTLTSLRLFSEGVP